MSDFADNINDFADALERFERNLASVEESGADFYELDEIKPAMEYKLEEVESLECSLRAMRVLVKLFGWPDMLREVDKLTFPRRLQKVKENAQKKLDQILKITAGGNKKKGA